MPTTCHQGRDFDLNEIRSELKGLHSVKQDHDESSLKQDPHDKTSRLMLPAATMSAAPAEPPQPDKQAEDVYEFKEPEPFELELHDEKKKRTHRIFDDISPSKYTSTLSKSLSEEISEDPLRPRPSTLRSPSLSPFRDFGGTRALEPGRQSPEEDPKVCLFGLDDDSFQGDGSSGPTFEGFTPAKNQETYSKKSKVSKLRELIDDSPESPADDEHSSEDEQDLMVKGEKAVSEPSPAAPQVETEKITENVKECVASKELVTQIILEPIIETNTETKYVTEEAVKQKEVPMEIIIAPERPKTPPQQRKEIHKVNLLSVPVSISNVQMNVTLTVANPVLKQEPVKESSLKLLTVPKIVTEPKENIPQMKIEQNMDPEPVVSKFEPPSSPLIDTEEDKSEPDSPARIDVIPEPPPGFLLQSEGPKIAEKLLKAINSAKRLSMSPPPTDDRSDASKTEPNKFNKPEIKVSSQSPELKTISSKSDTVKPLVKSELKKVRTPEISECIFGEPSNLTDAKRDATDVKKVRPKDEIRKEVLSPRLQSPLNILERRRSVADLPLAVPAQKNNKVLSDTIQKLSSQINQSAAAAVPLPLPPFPQADRSESSDSDDSDRR